MKLITYLAICTFSVSALQAQENQMLTLKDAIDFALQNKADSKKAKLDVENAEYQIAQVRSAVYPAINASGQLGYNPILQQTYIEGFGAIAMGQTWNTAAAVQIQQNLFNQQVFTGLKAAKTTREFYQLNSELTDEQVIERVATAYYNVFVAKKQLNTIDSSYVFTEKTRNIIKSLFDNGLAKKIDLDRVNVSLVNIQSTQQQLANAVNLQENALKFYIGMQISQQITLSDEDFEINKYLLNDSVEVENLTQMKVLEKQHQLLELQKETVKARFYPTLALTGTYAYVGLGNKFPLSSGTYWSDYATIGLSLNIPIFNGFAIKSDVQMADIGLRKLQQDIDDSKLGLQLDYQNAKAQIENNLSVIDYQKKNVELAQEVVGNTQNNYMQGLSNLTDLLDAENALVQAKNNYSNAVLQYKLAEVQLLKSKGELLRLKE
ncbi:MAG: TolC family protein [Flavobacteriaceae bacterium]|jgi:outer membrane protein TolC|nr:TolC family protein [Flavobacteriaceae bacterium]